jgi:hypothetical protein
MNESRIPWGGEIIRLIQERENSASGREAVSQPKHPTGV